MPRTPSKNSAPPAPVKNRNAAIRSSKLSQAIPDERDVAAGIDHSAPPATTTQSIDVRRAPEAGQAAALLVQAGRLVVTDRVSHEAALEFVRGAKQLARKITEHWQRITRSVDDLKRSMLNLKAADLGPVEDAIRMAEGVALAYENAERERVRRLEETQRQEREAAARQERQRELDAAEDKALELEQQSENLSARELWFVEKVFSNGLDFTNPTTTDLKAMMAIAREGGFKKPDVDVARLLRMSKITSAIQAKHEARAIREQADARRQQPINVIDAPPVQSNLAGGRGLPTTRSYHSCEVVDANKLREAFLNGEVPAEALIPNETYLNAQARAAKSAEIFERAFPGCRLKTRQGLAG